MFLQRCLDEAAEGHCDPRHHNCVMGCCTDDQCVAASFGGKSGGRLVGHWHLFVCWLVGCLTSQQQASVSQGRICEDNFTCCHSEIEAADQTFYLTQSQYTDAGPTSPSADPITPGAWQGSHWIANF